MAYTVQEQTSNKRSLIESKKRRAEAAKTCGISECIKLCPRSGKQDSVLSIAVSAIVGATWEDCRDLDKVALVILNLG